LSTRQLVNSISSSTYQLRQLNLLVNYLSLQSPAKSKSCNAQRADGNYSEPTSLRLATSKCSYFYVYLKSSAFKNSI